MADLTDQDEVTLKLLNTVRDDADATQRTISNDLGIALGLTNAYLKRCVKKGLIKVGQAPANRFKYYLTPKGFMEKSRLTAEFLTQSFNLFRYAREETARLYDQCNNKGWQRLILIGVDDIEINELIETIGAMVLRGIGLGVNHLMIGVQTADGPSRGVGGVGFVAVVGLRAGWSSTVVLRGDHARRARPRRAFPQATTLSIRAAST